MSRAPFAAALLALAACGPPAKDAALTLHLLRGDADPFDAPGADEATQVASLEARWETAAQAITQSAPIGADRQVQLRLAVPPPAEGRMLLRALRADGRLFSAGRTVTVKVSVDSPAEVPAFMGPVGAFTAVGPDVAGPRMAVAQAALGERGALLVGGFQGAVAGPSLASPSLLLYDLGQARLCGEPEGCLSGVAPPPRRDAIAIALGDGSVLHGLGRLEGGAADAALYLTRPDGATALLAALPVALYGAATVRVDASTVLVLGGHTATAPSAQVYRVDATSGAIAVQPPLLEARSSPVAVTLATGQILVAGGEGAAGPLATAEVYTPGQGSQATDGGAFAQARKSMRGPRVSPSVARLADDTVVIFGGGAPNPEVFRLELGVLVGGFVDLAAPPTDLRAERPALLNVGNDLLLVGGEPAGAANPIAAWFSPTPNQVLGPLSATYAGSYRAAGRSSVLRGQPGLVGLGDGSVLLAGGGTNGETPPDVANPGASRVEVLVPELE